MKSSEPLPEKLEAACRVVRERDGKFYVCLTSQVKKRSESQAPVSTHGVVALDPGVRTFQMCYDADGLVTEWGKVDWTSCFGTASRRTGFRSALPLPKASQARSTQAQSITSPASADSEQGGRGAQEAGKLAVHQLPRGSAAEI